jgi:hypothetical protein
MLGQNPGVQPMMPPPFGFPGGMYLSCVLVSYIYIYIYIHTFHTPRNKINKKKEKKRKEEKMLTHHPSLQVSPHHPSACQAVPA